MPKVGSSCTGASPQRNHRPLTPAPPRPITPRRLFVRKRTAIASVMGRPGRPACLILSGFRGHAPAGTWGRLSTWWPGQWHPFAVVSPPRREEGGGNHSMLIAPAGDWTKARIREAEAANGTAHQYYVRLLRAPGGSWGGGWLYALHYCTCNGAGLQAVPCVVVLGAAHCGQARA